MEVFLRAEVLQLNTFNFLLERKAKICTTIVVEQFLMAEKFG